MLKRLGKKQGKSKGEDGYGRGSASIAFDDEVLLDEEQMVAALLATIEAPDYRPPTLPSVAIDLMRLSQQPDVDFKDVIRLLEQDSMIAGRILKLVQSAVFSGATQITSLNGALVRLGLTTLRDLVIEISMNLKVYKSEDYGETMELLRQHSTATAHLAKLICKYTPIEGEFAFLAGLLHDVGIAGTLLALSERKGRRKTAPDLIAIWPAVDRVHQRAGELMSKLWELPPEIQMALSAHHQVMIQGYAHPLSATVCLANQLAHELGFGVIPKQGNEARANTLAEDCESSHTTVDCSFGKSLEHAQAALQITDVQMELIRNEALKLVDQLR